MLRVRITPYLDNEMSRIAQQFDCTRSDLVRVVLFNFVEDFSNEKSGG